MSMNNPNPSGTLVEVSPRRFRDVTSSAAADAELEVARALAVRAYERARGDRPCVVPCDQEVA